MGIQAKLSERERESWRKPSHHCRVHTPTWDMANRPPWGFFSGAERRAVLTYVSPGQLGLIWAQSSWGWPKSTSMRETGAASSSPSRCSRKTSGSPPLCRAGLGAWHLDLPRSVTLSGDVKYEHEEGRDWISHPPGVFLVPPKSSWMEACWTNEVYSSISKGQDPARALWVKTEDKFFHLPLFICRVLISTSSYYINMRVSSSRFLRAHKCRAY